MAAFSIRQVQVWAGDVWNRPGMLARVLEALSAAGAHLEFIVARQVNTNTSRVFIAPLSSPAEEDAARDVGLSPANSMVSLRVEAADRPGLAAQLARSIAGANVNVRGCSAAIIGRRAVMYFAFKTLGEADAAETAIRASLRGEKPLGAQPARRQVSARVSRKPAVAAIVARQPRKGR